MSLINGGLGGGDVIPPQASGGGSITLVESTDASVTVTGGSGPTVDLSVSGGATPSVLSGNALSTGLGHAGLPTVFLSTDSLSVGTWVVNVVACISAGHTPSSPSVIVSAVEGTATATLTGCISAENDFSAAPVDYNQLTVSLAFAVVVAVEGTVDISAAFTDVALNGTALSTSGYTALGPF